MSTQDLDALTQSEYKAGFVTDIDQETLPPGLNEDVVRQLSAKKGEPGWMTEWRLKAYRHWLTMKEPTWANVRYPPIDYQAISYYSAPEAEEGRRRRASTRWTRSCSRRTRSWACRSTSARSSPGSRSTPSSTASRSRPPSRRSCREAGVIFCSFSEAVKEHPRARAAVPRQRRARHRQLLRDPELGRLLRRLVRVRAEGRALPDGAQHLLPDQRLEDGPVRADADRRRGGRLRELPRGLHCADARREPAPRRRRRARRARGRADQVLDRAELVPGRQGRQGRDLQLRHEARQVRGRPLAHLVDAGRDRLGDHLEVPLLHPAGRRLGGGVLLGRGRRTTASRPTPAPR